MRRAETVVALLAVGLAVGGCGTLSGALRVDSALTAEPVRVTATPPPADEVVPVALTASGDSVEIVSAAVTDGTLVLSDSPALVAATPTADSSVTSPAADTSTPTPALPANVAIAAADTNDDTKEPALLAESAEQSTDVAEDQYDPWEKFNEKMFDFNRRLDRYVLKPVAKAYDRVMPDPFQEMIANGFDNIRWVPRFINSVLQAKWAGAGREVARFLINSTAGIGGLWDPAKNYWGIPPSKEDFGQTLGVWGAGPGPYLILPFLQPTTVRDGIGLAVDGFLDPLAYFIPFIPDRLMMRVGDTINDRSMNLELFQGFEESVIDMYSAVRHAYLKRREQLIRE